MGAKGKRRNQVPIVIRDVPGRTGFINATFVTVMEGAAFRTEKQSPFRKGDGDHCSVVSYPSL